MRLSSAQLTPLRLPGFRNLFFATLCSSAGTLLAAVALAIDVQQRTNSGPWVAAVFIVEFLPTIVVGLLLGPFLDRFERRSLMIGADAVRVGVFVALPFAPTAGWIVGLAGIAGLATGFFRPAVYAGIPNLVPDAELPSANALLQGVENLSWMLGPLVGAILTVAGGPSAAYGINAVSFAVSMLLVLRIPPRLLQSERALSRGHWTDLRDGFSTTFRSPSMRAVLVAWGIASVATGAANAVEIFLAKHTFHAGDLGFGLIFSAMGAGLVLGSAVSAGLLARLGVARTYGGSLALDGSRLPGGRGQPEHLGRVLLRPLHRRRERGGHQLQRPPRAARHLRPAAWSRADVRDQHHVCAPGSRVRARRPAPRPDRTALDLGSLRRAAGRRRARGHAAGSRKLGGETPAEDEVISDATPVAAAH